MVDSPSSRTSVLYVLIAALLVSTTSCSLRKSPSVSPEPSKKKPAAAGAAAKRSDTAPDGAPQRQAARKEGEIGGLRLQLLEREARIAALETRMTAEQSALDEAVQEVVRLKGMHRSLETRAEAAAGIAEAEIALKAFHDQETTATRPELARAEAFLKRAAEEFGKQNFGGALYLVGQAKNQIRLDSMESGDLPVTDTLEGEKPFAVPLPLVVVTRSNLREGPGQDFKVLAVLEQGTQIKGLSSKGLWVRIESREGLSGWLRLNLVAAS